MRRRLIVFLAGVSFAISARGAFEQVIGNIKAVDTTHASGRTVATLIVDPMRDYSDYTQKKLPQNDALVEVLVTEKTKAEGRNAKDVSGKMSAHLNELRIGDPVVIMATKNKDGVVTASEVWWQAGLLWKTVAGNPPDATLVVSADNFVTETRPHFSFSGPAKGTSITFGQGFKWDNPDNVPVGVEFALVKKQHAFSQPPSSPLYYIDCGALRLAGMGCWYSKISQAIEVCLTRAVIYTNGTSSLTEWDMEQDGLFPKQPDVHRGFRVSIGSKFSPWYLLN